MTLLVGRRRRSHSERGATLVELAIVGLVVFTLMLAVFEFGLLFRDNLTATDAVADATRIGAIVGPDIVDGQTADYAIVRAVREGLSSMNDASVEYIVVFKSSGTGDSPENQLPTACKSGSSLAGICNSYPARDAFRAVEDGSTDYFTCPDPADGRVSCAWNPTERKDGPTSADVESLGVWLKIRRDGFTGLFADEWTIVRGATSRLEPGLTEP